MDAAAAAWLTETVLAPAYLARSLLPDRCAHRWQVWEPTCEPEQVAASVVCAPRWPLEVGAELTDVQRRVLDLEACTWRRPGAKEQAIRDQFGVPSARYYQMVNRLVDSPAGEAYAPLLVGRLRRLRGRRR